MAKPRTTFPVTQTAPATGPAPVPEAPEATPDPVASAAPGPPAPAPEDTPAAPPAEPAPAAPAGPTVKVRLLGPICGPDRYHDAGDVIDLPAADAEVLLANHDVLPVVETTEAPPAAETAVALAAAETATAPAPTEVR